MRRLVESYTGEVVWDEEEGAYLLILDKDKTQLLHCGALIAGALAGKRVKITIEEEIPKSLVC